MQQKIILSLSAFLLLFIYPNFIYAQIPSAGCIGSCPTGTLTTTPSPGMTITTTVNPSPTIYTGGASTTPAQTTSTPTLAPCHQSTLTNNKQKTDATFHRRRRRGGSTNPSSQGVIQFFMQLIQQLLQLLQQMGIDTTNITNSTTNSTTNITTEPTLTQGPCLTITPTTAATTTGQATPTTATTATPTTAATSPTTTVTGATTGKFTISNNQITGPNGQTFKPHGINITDDSISSAIKDSSIQPLTSATYFPSLNFIRYNAATSSNLGDANGLPSSSTIQQYVTWATAKGIVIEIEYHPYTSTVNGSFLTDTLAPWYANLATTFKDNPYVWFGTQNEPNGSSGTQVSDEMTAIYNAVRGTGNNSPILLNPYGGGVSTEYMDKNALSAMTNTAWDLHFYNWVSNYSTDQATNDSALAKEITTFTSFVSLPVIIGEYGDSTDGSAIDAGWQQVLTAVHSHTNGNIGEVAWNWNGGGSADNLLNSPYDGTTGLSAYGQIVAAAIAAGK